jgi:hypothetical protein
MLRVLAGGEEEEGEEEEGRMSVPENLQGIGGDEGR